MKIAMLCFSRGGWETGERLRSRLLETGENLEISLDAKSKYVENSISESHGAWTGKQFQTADAIIFIGACGIAVRSIAPFMVSKKTDPAVLVIDECGKFVISLLSGHLGGANELTEQVAGLLGAIPVVTTATDLRDRFAVDVFASKNNCGIRPMSAAKAFSAALLAGETVGFYSEYPWEGKLPAGVVVCDEQGKKKKMESQIVTNRRPEDERAKAERPEERLETEKVTSETERKWSDTAASPQIGISVSIRKGCAPFPVTVHLIPRIVTLGMGCKKGKDGESIRHMAEQCLKEADIYRDALEGIASIDLKKEEPGILALAEKWQLPFRTFSAEELKGVRGDFTASEFVSSITGVDNVCERSAVRGSENGRLLRKKAGADGVTAALAKRDWRIRFE